MQRLSISVSHPFLYICRRQPRPPYGDSAASDIFPAGPTGSISFPAEFPFCPPPEVFPPFLSSLFPPGPSSVSVPDPFAVVSVPPDGPDVPVEPDVPAAPDVSAVPELSVGPEFPAPPDVSASDPCCPPAADVSGAAVSDGRAAAELDSERCALTPGAVVCRAFVVSGD